MLDSLEVDHIGIATADAETSIKLYRDILGLKVLSDEIVESQKTRVIIFKTATSKIELLVPTSSDSPIQKFLDKKGPGQHHIALRTKDIRRDLKRLKDLSVILIDENPKVGAMGALIAFIHPKSANGTLLELCQPNVAD